MGVLLHQQCWSLVAGATATCRWLHHPIAPPDCASQGACSAPGGCALHPHRLRARGSRWGGPRALPQPGRARETWRCPGSSARSGLPLRAGLGSAGRNRVPWSPGVVQLASCAVPSTVMLLQQRTWAGKGAGVQAALPQQVGVDARLGWLAAQGAQRGCLQRRGGRGGPVCRLRHPVQAAGRDGLAHVCGSHA